MDREVTNEIATIAPKFVENGIVVSPRIRKRFGFGVCGRSVKMANHPAFPSESNPITKNKTTIL